MTVLLDASAVISLLADEPGAAEVVEFLGADAGACSAVNLAEATDWLVRLGGVSLDDAHVALDQLVAAGLVVVSCDDAIARLAGELRARWYDRRTAAISLADCVAIATALTTGGILVSNDAVLCRIATRAGAVVHPIPNSSGRRPRR